MWETLSTRVWPAFLFPELLGSSFYMYDDGMFSLVHIPLEVYLVSILLTPILSDIPDWLLATSPPHPPTLLFKLYCFPL